MRGTSVPTTLSSANVEPRARGSRFDGPPHVDFRDFALVLDGPAHVGERVGRRGIAPGCLFDRRTLEALLAQQVLRLRDPQRPLRYGSNDDPNVRDPPVLLAEKGSHADGRPIVRRE